MNNLVFWFLHKDVMVEADGFRVHGRLVAVSEGNRGREHHRPMVLALLDSSGQKFLVRGWSLIAVEAEREVKESGF